jgi:hypothetical protein
MALLLSEEKGRGNGKNTGSTIRLFSLGSILEARKMVVHQSFLAYGPFSTGLPKFGLTAQTQ